MHVGHGHTELRFVLYINPRLFTTKLLWTVDLLSTQTSTLLLPIQDQLTINIRDLSSRSTSLQDVALSFSMN